jgi:predicted PurR-regulated permease PerM
MDSPSDFKAPNSGSIDGHRVKRYSWWWVVSALAVGLILGIGFLAVFNMIARPLALIILAIAIATALNPIVDRLDRRIPRVLAAILVYLILLLILVGIAWLIVPTLFAQATSLINNLPGLIDEVQEFLENVTFINVDEIFETAFDQIGTFAIALIALPLNAASYLIDILLILFVALYWIILTPQIKTFFLSLFPIDRRNRLESVLDRMGGAMGGYVRGVAIDGLIIAVLTTIGLTIIGVEFAMVLGIVAGMLEIIPVVGPFIGGFLILSTALAQDPSLVLPTLIFVLILQQVESNILVPNIMKTQTEISPLLVLLAVFIGSTIGGLIGALAAIPLVAALRVLIRYMIAPAIRVSTGAPPLEHEEELEQEAQEKTVKEYPDPAEQNTDKNENDVV